MIIGQCYKLRKALYVSNDDNRFRGEVLIEPKVIILIVGKTNYANAIRYKILLNNKIFFFFVDKEDNDNGVLKTSDLLIIFELVT